MPKELEGAKQTIQVDGKDVVVYDAAKVEEFVTARETAFTTEKTTLEQAAKDAAEKLSKATEKDADFAALRTAKDAADKALAEATEKHQKEVGELKAAPLKEHRGNLVTLLSGDDKNVKEKVEHHLSKTLAAMPETTKAEIDAKVQAAYQLAVGADFKPDFVQRVISSAGGSAYKPAAAVTPELKGIGAKFGLNDKDFEAAQNQGVLK